MTRTLGFLIGIFWLGFIGGCSQYVEDFYYVPQPVVADVPPATQGQPSPVSAVASIVGILRENHKANIPLSVEVRVRLDNNGPQTVTFDPHSLELTNGTLLHFEPPAAEPPTPITLAPAQSAIATARFPFPSGRTYNNTDLSTLQLRWILGIDNRQVRQVLNFTRAYPAYYYDPYYYRPYPYYYRSYPYPYHW